MRSGNELSREDGGRILVNDDLDDLQEAFAWIDLMSKHSHSNAMELMVVERDHVKLRMRCEGNHELPHFHLEYKKQYSASYQITPFRRLAGFMPKNHEQKLSGWIMQNQANLQATWNALKSGKDVRELVIEKNRENK